MTEYKIIENINSNAFTFEVNKYIRLGWQPLGGVCVVNRSDGYKYIQTMIREEVEVRLKP